MEIEEIRKVRGTETRKRTGVRTRTRTRAKTRAKTRGNIIMTRSPSTRATASLARRGKGTEPQQPPAAQHLKAKPIVSSIKGVLLFFLLTKHLLI